MTKKQWKQIQVDTKGNNKEAWRLQKHKNKLTRVYNKMMKQHYKGKQNERLYTKE